MQLKEFIESELKLIDHFQRYWKERHEHDPKNFPLDLKPGDWDEQLIIFHDLCNEIENETIP